MRLNSSHPCPPRKKIKTRYFSSFLRLFPLETGQRSFYSVTLGIKSSRAEGGGERRGQTRFIEPARILFNRGPLSHAFTHAFYAKEALGSSRLRSLLLTRKQQHPFFIEKDPVLIVTLPFLALFFPSFVT